MCSRDLNSDDFKVVTHKRKSTKSTTKQKTLPIRNLECSTIDRESIIR